MNSPHQGPPRRDRSLLDHVLFAELCLLPPATWPVEPDLPAEPVDAVWPVGGNLLDVLRPLTRRRIPALPPAPPPSEPMAPAAIVVAEPPPRAAIDGPFAGETVQVCLPPLDALLGPPADAPPVVDAAPLVTPAPSSDNEDPQTPLLSLPRSNQPRHRPRRRRTWPIRSNHRRPNRPSSCRRNPSRLSRKSSLAARPAKRYRRPNQPPNRRARRCGWPP
ncbi:MAG: hypothetical protein U0736_10860 [Gemmataceae bacterium]